MKKLFLSLSLVSVCAFSFAQVEHNVTKTDSFDEIEDVSSVMVNNFRYNWNLSAAVGAQLYMGEYSFQPQKFFDMWTVPSITVDIDKWSSPYFGLGFGVNFAGYKGLYGPGDDHAAFAHDGDKHADRYDGTGYNLFYARGSYIDLYVKGLFSISNLIKGYNPARKFDFNGYVGGGVVFGFNKDNQNVTAAAFNAGLQAKWKLTDKFDFNINAGGAFVSDNFNGIGNDAAKKNFAYDGIFETQIGLTYKFGKVTRTSAKTGESYLSEWVPMTTFVKTSQLVDEVVDREVAAVEQKKDAEIAEVKQEAAKEVEVVKQEVVKQEQVAAVLQTSVATYFQYVCFELDKWVIRPAEKVRVQLAADMIKSAPQYKFVITGSADRQTGKVAHNKMLSENRAKAVRDMLVNEFGVPADQLEIVALGGINTKYYNINELARAVEISVKK